MFHSVHSNVISDSAKQPVNIKLTEYNNKAMRAMRFVYSYIQGYCDRGHLQFGNFSDLNDREREVLFVVFM